MGIKPNRDNELHLTIGGIFSIEMLIWCDSIHSQQGEIFVDGPLGREIQETYTVTAIARDNPILEPSRRSTVSLTIELSDVNDNPPLFDSGQST